MNLFKFISILLLILSSCATQKKYTSFEVQKDLQIIDIATSQLGLLNKHKDDPKKTRDDIFISMIHNKNTHLWEGYLGNEEKFIDWIDQTALSSLKAYNEKTTKIDLNEMNKYFNKTIIEMANFTGYKPKGTWYIFWGPGWTDLGGFADGTMLIDLASSATQDLEHITSAFPHEINHQIYSHTIPDPSESTVISKLIDEGFACYVSYKFNQEKNTIAEELHYSESEYQTCLNLESEILDLIRENYLSEDEDEIKNFANRSYHFEEEYPGGLGYFIGFRIVEEYVRRNGKNSWKDIYTMSPLDVLNKSEILK